MPDLSAIAMQPLRMGTPHEGQNRQSSVLTSIEEELKPAIQVSELSDVTSGVNTTPPSFTRDGPRERTSAACAG